MNEAQNIILDSSQNDSMNIVWLCVGIIAAVIVCLLIQVQIRNNEPL
jgi:hypothetical protein